MQLIYATGQPRNMEFAVANSAATVPADATVLATCTRDAEVEHLDDHTFATMTDAEFYSFRSLVNTVRRLESRRAERAATAMIPPTFGEQLRQLLLG